MGEQNDDLAARLAEAFEREQRSGRARPPAPEADETQRDAPVPVTAEEPTPAARARAPRKTATTERTTPPVPTDGVAQALAEQRTLLGAIEARLAAGEATAERVARTEAELARLADAVEDLGARIDELGHCGSLGRLFGGRSRPEGR